MFHYLEVYGYIRISCISTYLQNIIRTYLFVFTAYIESVSLPILILFSTVMKFFCFFVAFCSSFTGSLTFKSLKRKRYMHSLCLAEKIFSSACAFHGSYPYIKVCNVCGIFFSIGLENEKAVVALKNTFWIWYWTSQIWHQMILGHFWPTYLPTLIRCFTTQAYLIKSDRAWPTYLPTLKSDNICGCSLPLFSIKFISKMQQNELLDSARAWLDFKNLGNHLPFQKL